jgi:cell division protein YceG involved in septum cleavage
MARRALVVLGACFALAGCGGAASAPPATTAPPPPPKPFRIVFPEGFTRVQMGVRVKVVAAIAERERHRPVRLSQPAYLAASRRAAVPCFGRGVRTGLEGFLFPATYDFLRRTPSRQLVAAQLAAFCRSWRKVDLGYARSKNLTAYDVLTIASMIEKEAAVPAERPLMAAVIYNRLHARMPLGIDATLRYGLHIPPTRSILQSQLQNPTPYNSRIHLGLPPTPVSNPGLASIRAAAHPAHVDYLYYARKRDHRHHFFTASASAYNQFLAQNGYG